MERGRKGISQGNDGDDTMHLSEGTHYPLLHNIINLKKLVKGTLFYVHIKSSAEGELEGGNPDYLG